MMKNIRTMMIVLSALVAQTSACDAGSAPQGGECKFCPTGTYALAGDLYCTRCPPGFWAPINSVSKDACYPLSAFRVAEVCPAGSAPLGDACAFCPVGSYSLAGAPSCTSCPAGQSSPPNSVSFDACFLKSSKKVKDVTCGAGSVDIDGICTFCPAGQYALAGAKVCSHCAPGYWSPINSVSPDACYPLSAFRVAELCPAGSAPENDVCTFCPVGSYSLVGAQSCTKCPAGQSSPINSVSPDACFGAIAAVKSSSNKNKKVREAVCAPGSAPVNGVCTSCPVGSYALAAQQSCTQCAPGFSAPVASVSPDACYPLSAKKVADIACAAGSAPVNGVCTFCPVGSYALAAAAECTQCPAGQSSPPNSVSPDACFGAAIGAAVRSSKATKDVLVCPPGSAPENGVCAFCPVGSYALAASEACTKCPKGFSSPPNSVSPDACAPSSHKNKKVKEVCAAGYAPVNGVCTTCPVGSYALAAAQSCTQCAPGFSAPVTSVSPDACYPVAKNLRQ